MSGQNFRTSPAPNFSAALYQLSIRAPGFSLLDLATYTFPISPTSLRYAPSGMSSHADTQGPPSQNGVSRVMDVFGLSPPIILIEGTTGWDYHATDGSILTGLQSIQLLQQFLARYAQLNQAQRQAGVTDYYTLEFYDYFLGQFWVVEPEGPQIVRLAADRPALSYYRFRWAAVRSVSAPLLGELDALLSVFGTPAQAAAVNAATTVGALLVAYSPVGLVSAAASL